MSEHCLGCCGFVTEYTGQDAAGYRIAKDNHPCPGLSSPEVQAVVEAARALADAHRRLLQEGAGLRAIRGRCDCLICDALAALDAMGRKGT
jgi:hypothetical protein